MEDKKPDNRSFLLRVWIEETDRRLWRFSLEDTFTGKRKGFASLKDLCAYLEELIESSKDLTFRNE